MEYLPIFTKVKGLDCLVLGCNDKAMPKVKLLLQAGAKVTVVSTHLCKQAQALVEEKKILHLNQSFEEVDIAAYRLAIAAEDDIKINQKISQAAREAGVPINVVDTPELCDFIFPSIIDRSPLIAAISTGGASPTLARVIRSRIELMLPHSYGRLAHLLSSVRDSVKEAFPDTKDRKRFWDKLFSGSIIEMFLGGKETESKKALQAVIKRGDAEGLEKGCVCLVGAGPGDSGLLTLHALRHIQNADAIVYDRLIGSEVLDFARRDAELVYAGKQKSLHSMPQEEINQCLIRLAKEGKKVVRLKGGDPFIFGRGGEEVESLIDAGINFQVIPGVTAAAGCGAYSGIPLTHRDYARTCVFATGHLKNGRLELNWEALAQPQQTIVFYMGLSNLRIVCTELMRCGLPESWPAAIVQDGTRPNQKVVTGTLGNLPELAEQEKIEPPTLVIVGEVVKLHQSSKSLRAKTKIEV